MIRKQCKKCGRHAYSNGKCYADRKIAGKPVGDYVYCWWATPKESLSKKHQNLKKI